jgi:hypothetical protein
MSSGRQSRPALDASDGDAATEDATEMADAAPESDGGFDAGRRLCDDGSCVGVVGPDGVCRTCGRRAEA